MGDARKTARTCADERAHEKGLHAVVERVRGQDVATRAALRRAHKVELLFCQAVALLARDSLDAAFARRRQVFHVHPLDVQVHPHLLALGAHEGLVGIGRRAAQEMIHVQYADVDGGGVGQEAFEGPLRLEGQGAPFEIGANHLEQSRGIRPARDHEHDAHLLRRATRRRRLRHHPR